MGFPPPTIAHEVADPRGTGRSGDFARMKVFSPETVKATRPFRFGPAPSMATIRPIPYCGCMTVTPGWKASRLAVPATVAGGPPRSAAVVRRNVRDVDAPRSGDRGVDGQGLSL